VSNRDNLPIFEEQADAQAIGQVSVPATRPEIPPHFYRTNSRGLIECVDATNGRVICVQASAFDLLESKFDRLVKINTPQGPVYLERGLNFDLANLMPAIPYSKLLADLLCEKLAEGKTMVVAAKELNIPYSVIRYWRREVPDFTNALAEAAKDRAEVFHDEAIETSRTASKKEKISTLQWAAEKGDQAKYGSKKPGSEGGQGNITFVINTGIRRPGDEGYTEVIETQAKSILPEPNQQNRETEEIAVFNVAE
jgi:hypothetical protein